MPHLFISYSKKDTRELALNLADALNTIEGVTTWVDRSLRAGRSWELQIQNEIDRCDTMIVLYSPDINRHKQGEEESYVLTEISYARYTARKPIIPIMAQRTDPPISLTQAHYIDFTIDDLTLTDLVEAICIELDIVPTQPATHVLELPVEIPEIVADTMPTEPEDINQPELVSDTIFTEAVRDLSEIAPEDSPIVLEPVVSSFESVQSEVITPADTISEPDKFQTRIPPPRHTNPLVRFLGVIIGLVLVFLVIPLAVQFGGSLLQRSIPTVTANDQWTPVIQEFDGVEMALVPPGCFMMGSEDGDADERPVHEVCFDEPFWIDRYEVTNRQYGSSGRFEGDGRPRETVSWPEALAHCQSQDARLPTEAEWEYTARGPDHLVYPWGNDFVAENVVYRGNSHDETADVGSYLNGISWVGVFDLSGNVWEWVSTIYDQEQFEYPYTMGDGREDVNRIGVRRTLRGGSWHFTSNDVRAAGRHRDFPGSRSSIIGFRCARDYEG